MSKADLQKTFESVARAGLSRAKKRDVVVVARAVWHEDFVPDLYSLRGQGRKDGGYLVDYLSRFSVLPKEKRRHLSTLAKEFRPHGDLDSLKGAGADPLSLLWGATSDLNEYVNDLLPMQTRHYARAHKNGHPG